MSDTEDAVLVERRDRIMIITLNRPDAMNAINGALSHGLLNAVRELDEDSSLTAGIITGNGIIRYNDTNFAGRLFNYDVTPHNVTSEGLVRLLVNQVPKLKFNTVFINENCEKCIHTKDGNTFKLLPGDEIHGESDDGSYVYGYNNGNAFKIFSTQKSR